MTESYKTIFELIGSYDNSGEPEPLWNKPEAILGILISSLIITWAAVLLRLYTRFFVVKAPGWDDLFVFIAIISGTLGSICICLSVEYGLGRHIGTLLPIQIKEYLIRFYIANGSYCVSTAAIKISLLLQYLRIFERGTFLRRASIVILVFTSLWGIAFTIIAYVPCFPVYSFWNLGTGVRNCYGYGSLDPGQFTASYTSHASINMILDIIVLALPVPLYFRPDASTRTKVGLCGLLFMGLIVNILGVSRLATIAQHKAATWPTFDPTWYGPVSIILAAVEVDAATVCASAPIFWPLISARWSGVFVTQEIKITRHQRMDECDEIELSRSHDHYDIPHSRAESDVSLNLPLELTRSGSKAPRDKHYKDRFIMGQVDPLRPKSTAGVDTLVVSESGKQAGEKSRFGF